MRKVLIIDGARTPIGRFGKNFRNVPAVDLGCHAIKAAIKRSHFSPDQVENVILGAIHQEGMGNAGKGGADLFRGWPGLLRGRSEQGRSPVKKKQQSNGEADKGYCLL